jgi:hypothetical protein
MLAGRGVLCRWLVLRRRRRLEHESPDFEGMRERAARDQQKLNLISAKKFRRR